MRHVVLVLSCLAVLAGAATAHADEVKLNAADQALARTIVLKASELGPGWSGSVGFLGKAAVANSPLNCPRTSPTSPTLVATGAAEGAYASTHLDLDAAAEVLASHAMLRAAWQLASTPRILACARAGALKGSAGTVKILSLERLAYPTLTRYTTGFRIVTRITVNGTTARYAADVLFAGKGRTELTVTTIALGSTPLPPLSEEAAWARKMVARTPAS